MVRAILVVVIVGVYSIGAVNINTDHTFTAPASANVLQDPVSAAYLQPAAGSSILNSNDTITN